MGPRLLPLCAAPLLAVWLLVPAAGQALAPGAIAGQVRLGTKPAGRALSTATYSRHISAQPRSEAELTHVLVWVKDPPARPAVAPRQAELRQRDETFVPRVLAVTSGSTVTFPNDDPIFHNVFSLSRSATFDLGRFRQGDARSRRFTGSGLVKVFCHLHSHMSAIIAVFDHPWFAQVAADGSFRIPDVPPGRYTVTGWHERAGATERSVVVQPGATTRLDLLVPIEPS
jgi:plastocyanin